jgi:hypothetical protein
MASDFLNKKASEEERKRTGPASDFLKQKAAEEEKKKQEWEKEKAAYLADGNKKEQDGAQNIPLPYQSNTGSGKYTALRTGFFADGMSGIKPYNPGNLAGDTLGNTAKQGLVDKGYIPGTPSFDPSKTPSQTLNMPWKENAAEKTPVEAPDPMLQLAAIAQQNAAQKDKALDNYVASDEAKNKPANVTVVQGNDPAATAGSYIGSILGNLFKTGNAKGDEKQAQLQAEADVFREIETNARNQYIMQKDLAEYETWPEEDKKLLQAAVHGINANSRSNARNKLVDKYGEDTVANIKESYSRNWGAGVAEKLTELAQNATLGDGLLTLPLSVGGSVFSAADQLGQVVAESLGGTTGRYQGIDPYSPGQLLNVYTDAVRKKEGEIVTGAMQAAAEAQGADEKTQETIGKVTRTVYGAGMSALENLARVAVTGGVGSLVLAGVAGFSQGVREATMNGASSFQAVSVGLIKGASEVLTEKLPLDNLMDALKGAGGSKGVLSIVAEALQQAGIEATTEEVNLIAGLAAEAIILQEKSGYNTMIRQLMAQGVPYAEAVSRANKALIEEAGQTAIQSALSGGMMSAGSNIVTNMGTNTFAGAADQYEQDKQSGQEALQNVLDGILPQRNTEQAETKKPAVGAQGTQEGATSKGINVSDLVDETLAQANGAPADPVNAAVESFESTGNISNKMATDILNSAKAVQQLVKEAGMPKLEGMTSAQKRQAVKDAVKVMAESKVQSEVASNVSTNAVSQTLESYPAEKQKTIRSYLQSVDQKIKSFVERVKNGNLTFKREKISDVSERAAADIGRLLGIDVSGYTNNINTNGIKHILRRHGENGKADSSMSVDEDIARVGWVLENYDTVEMLTKDGKQVYSKEFKDKNGNPVPQIRFVKKIDGTYYVVEAAYENQYKKLWVQGAYLQKNGDVTQVSAEGKTANRKTNAQSELASPSPNPIIHNDSETVNTENGAVGAAEEGFSGDLYRQIYEHGNIPEGENAVRPDVLPKSTDGKDRVSYTARTALEAKVTPDAFAQLIENETVKGGFSYIPIKNSDTVQKAVETIQKKGWEDAKIDWTAAVRGGKSSTQLTAIGALLYNNAVNSGAYKEALNILSDYQMSIRNSAQALQAARILKTLTPENRLYMIQKSIDQMVEDMHLDTEITIDDALMDEYINAESEEQRDEVITEIKKQVAEQLPATMSEKFTALRYVNMLGNFKTQIKNIAGNLTMKAVRSLQNGIGTTLEAIANKLSGGKVKRTRSFTVSKEQMTAAKNNFDSVKSIMDGGKFNETDISDEFMKGVQKERRIFKLAPLEGYRKITNWAMEQGDIVFAKSAYARALAGYLKANGITETDYSKVDTAIMDDAQLFAANEAQEATFRDTNWLSGWVSKIGRRKDTPKAVKVISEGTMPFRKTPANVLVRAEEYSPLGVINSVVISIKAMQKDSDVTATDVINSWSKTLTGTGIFSLGMLLQSLGLLSTGPDDDEGKEDFENLNGWQNYAITLPDGTNLTIDAFSPSSIPLLMGAELNKLIDENGFQLKDLEKALTSIAQPMIEMSMLQGVSDTLDNIQYADNNLGQLLINAAVSYLTQGLTNTLAGQIERTFEGKRMTTYVDKDSELPDWLQRALGKASAKIPGWDYNQIPYINAWGEEEENPHWAENGAYNLLSPSYIEKGISTEFTQELNRLNDAVSDVNVYPTRPDKTVKVNKEDYNLSADEYVELAKLQGQTQKKLVEGILSSESYSLLSDEEKAKAISFAYEYARGKARGEVVPEHPGIETKWMKALQGNVADGIIRHVKTGTTAKYLDISIESAAYISNILDGLTAQSGYTNVRDVQRLEAVVDAPKLSDKEQESVLRDIMGDALEKKFDKALDMGISADDFVEAYRIQLDTKGDGKKAKVIKYYTDKLGLDKATAESLYKLYSGAK